MRGCAKGFFFFRWGVGVLFYSNPNMSQNATGPRLLLNSHRVEQRKRRLRAPFTQRSIVFHRLLHRTSPSARPHCMGALIYGTEKPHRYNNHVYCPLPEDKNGMEKVRITKQRGNIIACVVITCIRADARTHTHIHYR